eukprot:TRINITY_DN6629_c0_g1_i2.p1 TRINITY_DN6629_c0_g1~~TRINITY_DN6629_c0_g1_i2.p1  ORF type:complete len:190 (+),score=41.45 TRINITY_DN6629_c0_g1_i2:102-671(+)
MSVDEDVPCFTVEGVEGEEDTFSGSVLPSNVLIIFGLGARTNKDYLEKVCASYGDLRAFKYIRIFKKAVAVFVDTDDAISCHDAMKEKWDVQYGLPLTDKDLLSYQLCPPPNDKPFLISPPCSPPPEWKGGREHPPENTLPPDFTMKELSDKLYMVFEGESKKGLPPIIVQRPSIGSGPIVQSAAAPQL